MKQLIILLVCLFEIEVSAQDKPNIVLLCSDNAGYADFGFHGSTIMKTSHLEKLAKQGILFTQGYFYNPTCDLSRLYLLTGKYQQQFGFEENNIPNQYLLPMALINIEISLIFCVVEIKVNGYV